MAGGLFGRFFDAFANVRTSAKPYSEQGVAGFGVYGGYIQTAETNAAVSGPNRWITAADLLSNISVIAASVRYTLNLISRPKWKADPPSDKQDAKDMAEFVEEVINGIDTSWARIVRRSGIYRYHGFNLQEWVAKKRDDGKIGIAAVEPRPAHTITKWDVDENGGILGVVQTSPQTGQELYLPRGKLVYLVDDELTDRPEGLGWFRHLAEPTNRLKRYLKLETMGFERDLAGIPVGRAPLQRINQLVKEGKLSEKQAEKMVKALEDFVKMQAKEPNSGLLFDSEPFRAKGETGETISSVMQWGLELLTGSPGTIDALGKAIERLEFDMALIMGTESMLIGRSGQGSRALSEDKSRNLYLTSNSALQDMAEAYDRDLVTPLWTMNGFPDDLRPKLKTEDVAFKDAATIAKALADMAAAGAILHPNDPAINDLRDALGVSAAPPVDEKTAGLMLNAHAGLLPNANDNNNGPGGGGRPSRENPDGGAGGKPPKDPQSGPNRASKFNPNHVPSGPDGGQFTSATDLAGPPQLADYMQALATDPKHHPNIEGLQVADQPIFNPGKSAGIRRENMPQIPDEHRDAFLATVPNRMEMANPHTLYPTQDQLDGYKVGLFATNKDIPFQTPIVSSDNYVVDGHHHWGSAVVKSIVRGADQPTIPIHRIGLSRDELLARAHAYAADHGFKNEPLWKYDPNEPRDDHGRWTSGGVGSIQQLSPQQMREAMRILQGAKWSYSPTTIADLNRQTEQMDETLDHAAWEKAGDFKPWQSAFKYSPDEPRDYHGRWTADGGALGNPSFKDAMGEVITKGKSDKLEHIVALDSSGNFLFHGDGKSAEASVDAATDAKLDDPSYSIDIVHNHPPAERYAGNITESLSAQDVSTLTSPGERSVTAVGHDGSWFTATTDDRDALTAAFEDGRIGSKYHVMSYEAEKAVDAGKMSKGDAQLLAFHAMWISADHAGYVKYSYHLSDAAAKVFADRKQILDDLVRSIDRVGGA